MQTTHDLYQLVVPLAGIGVWERDLQTKECYFNTVVRELFEIEDGDTTEPEMLLTYFQNPEYVRELAREVIRTGQPAFAELEIVTPKGNVKWIRVRMHSSSGNGHSRCLFGSIENITEQLNLMKLVQEREQQLSLAFMHAPIGMALVSLKGEWIKINDSLCNLMGYDEREFLQHTFQDYTHPEDLDLDLAQMNQLIAGDIEVYSMEKRYFHKDGHIIWALLNVSLVRDDDGKPLYFVSQIKDITERKRNSEIIRAQNDRLLNFAHIVSHNLRSHTGNIKMLTDMIAQEKDPEEHKRQIGMLNDSANKLLETLSELNDVVRVHEQGIVHRETLNLLEKIERVTAILSAEIQVSGAKIETDIPPNLTVRYNPAYLESIFVNLITNSIKYKHPDRSPVIRITVNQSVEQVIIRVSDNGLGIDMALHGHKLFGMYKTFHGNKDARGMGLFLVKNQVEAMGSKIYAESQPGVGSCFILEINKI